MKEITLGKTGLVAMVDDEDFEWLNHWKWRARIWDRVIYAIRVGRRNGKRTTIGMHRMIMNAPSNMEVDHINHNGLCNLRENLRICTHSQNQRHRRASVNGSSKYIGVTMTRHTRVNKGGESVVYLYWVANASKGNDNYYLGNFKDECAAAMCYDMYVIKEYGEFATLNFPEKKDDYWAELEKEGVSVG